MRSRIKEIFQEIALNHLIEIDRIEVSTDRVHVFLSFPPRYSIARVVGMFKSISASIIFEQYPEIKVRAKAMAKQFLGERIFSKDSGR